MMTMTGRIGLVEVAVASGRNGLSCSEAMLATYGTHWGLGREQALALAGGLAGGMGQSGNACGVVTASVVVLGLMSGSCLRSCSGVRECAMMLARDFVERFIAVHGSVECRDLCLARIRGMDMEAGDRARAIRHSGMPDRLIRSASAVIEALAAELWGELPADPGPTAISCA